MSYYRKKKKHYLRDGLGFCFFVLVKLKINVNKSTNIITLAPLLFFLLGNREH